MDKWRDFQTERIMFHRPRGNLKQNPNGRYIKVNGLKCSKNKNKNKERERPRLSYSLSYQAAMAEP